MANVRAVAAPAYRLQATLPEWMALKWQHAAACAIYVTAFCVLSYVPVSSPLTWQAIAQGHVAGDSGAALRIPLSEGIRHANLSWAANWASAALFNYGGPQLVAVAYALLFVVAVILWNLAFYALSRSWWSLPGAIFVGIASMPACDGLNAQLIGSGLLALFVASLAFARDLDGDSVPLHRLGRGKYLAVGALIVGWVNLDVSVVWALCILALLCGERLLWVVRRGVPSEFSRDQELQSRLLMLEVAIVATLCNPMGIEWWSTLFWWPDSALGRALGGWASPGIVSWYGLTFVSTWTVIAKVAARTGRTDSLSRLLPIVGSILLATFPSTAFSAIPLLWCGVYAKMQPALSRATVSQTVPSGEAASTAGGMRFAYTLFVVLLLWVGFNVSPLRHRSDMNRRSLRELLGPEMPATASRYLAETAGDSVVLAPGRWSDFLLVTTGCRLIQVHDSARVPALVTQDCHEILRGTNGWESLAEKYALNHIVAHKSQHARLVHSLRQGVEGWRILYEDGLAVIACRK